MSPDEIAIQSLSSRTATYLRLRKGDARELMGKKAGSFAIELYKASTDAAPTPAQIAADVKALGWRVKRKPGAWRRRPGETAQQTLQRMQNAVITARVNRRYYVASGWLPAVYAYSRGSGGRKRTVRPVQNPRGRVEIRGTPEKLSIHLINETPGITYVAEKARIIPRAAGAVEADMQQYIDRKLSEAKAKAGLGRG